MIHGSTQLIINLNILRPISEQLNQQKSFEEKKDTVMCWNTMNMVQMKQTRLDWKLMQLLQACYPDSRDSILNLLKWTRIVIEEITGYALRNKKEYAEDSISICVRGKASCREGCVDSLSWHGSHFEFELHFVRCDTMTVSPNQIILLLLLLYIYH